MKRPFAFLFVAPVLSLCKGSARGVFTRKTHGAVCRQSMGLPEWLRHKKAIQKHRICGFYGWFPFHLAALSWASHEAPRPGQSPPRSGSTRLALSRRAWSSPATRSWALLEKPPKKARIGTLKAEGVCKGNAEPEISSRCFCNSRIVIVVHGGK